MDKIRVRPATVDEYIAQLPGDVQDIASRIRAAIMEAAPDAEERISYDMPGYFMNGELVWFGVWRDFVSLYPLGPNHPAFREELQGYEGTKGSVHFPLDRPIPYDLIRRIVAYRVAENLAEAPES